jgi:protein-S-isoprenylcysteine O-methyltransferase Ste14
MELRKAARDPWVWGQLVLVALVGIGAPLVPRHINLGAADFFLNRVDPLWIRSFSVILLAAGLLLMLWAARSLGKNLTPGTEPVADGKLITHGAYAHLRHPMYAGVVLLLAGYTLAWSNWTLALLVGLLARAYFGAKARVEEKRLSRRFPAYQRYIAQVSRRLF